MLTLEQLQYNAFAGSEEGLLKDMVTMYEEVSIPLACIGQCLTRVETSN